MYVVTAAADDDLADDDDGLYNSAEAIVAEESATADWEGYKPP